MNEHSGHMGPCYFKINDICHNIITSSVGKLNDESKDMRKIKNISKTKKCVLKFLGIILSKLIKELHEKKVSCL